MAGKEQSLVLKSGKLKFKHKTDMIIKNNYEKKTYGCSDRIMCSKLISPTNYDK